MYSTEIKDKMKSTIKDKYGVDNYTKTEEYKTRINELYFIELNKKLEQRNLTFINKTEKTITLKCNDCNNIFSYSISAFNTLIKVFETNFCPECSRIFKNQNNTSKQEKEFVSFIKEIYKNKINENDRKILNGKELDIYIPELKLAFEYDGTYWHADPRFFNENDKIKHCLASDIWERDKQKDLLCEQNGIKLIRIKEYDWKNDSNKIKQYIREIINEKN